VDFIDDTFWEYVDDAFFVWESVPSEPGGLQVMVNLVWTANPLIEDVDLYEVQLDGVVAGTTTKPEFDLSALPDGTYVARIRAHNTWGWSALSDPFGFTKKLPTKPIGLGLLAQ